MGSHISPRQIEDLIIIVRGEKVLLDQDLAKLYDVETKVLNQAVKRNASRFPSDFMFQLTHEELENLRSQNVTSSHGGRRYPPFAFTEQGVAMLSSVLRSPRAIQVNVEIMRTFVHMRKMLITHEDIQRQLTMMERKYDSQFRVVFDAIRQLMAPVTPKPKRRIGFNNDTEE